VVQDLVDSAEQLIDVVVASSFLLVRRCVVRPTHP
jgi:hypothetical protein